MKQFDNFYYVWKDEKNYVIVFRVTYSEHT